MLQILIYISTLFYPFFALKCEQCGGDTYSAGLRLSLSSCCNPSPIECEPTLACLRALVTSPKSSFFLSGCHASEDGLIGCDTHSLPHNASVQRCTCLDASCQSYFPGNCPLLPDRGVSSTLSFNHSSESSSYLNSGISQNLAIDLRQSTIARLNLKRTGVLSGINVSINSFQIITVSLLLFLI